jgi:hypothetical protein
MHGGEDEIRLPGGLVGDSNPGHRRKRLNARHDEMR